MSSHGQASTEYVAILLVVATALAGAASLAVAAAGVGERVVKGVRTGLCVLGGDICRRADASAAGLGSCLTSERSRREDTTLDLALVRLGEHGEWQLALQSDGRAVVTRLDEDDAGGTVGVGLAFSPARVSVQASAAVVATYRSGRAWRFPDAPSATAFLETAMREGISHARPPDVHWHALGDRAGGEAGVALGDLASAGVRVAAGSAIGIRADGARRTLTFLLGVDEPHLAVDLPGLRLGRGTARTWAADLSWEGGELRELALRTATGDGERLEELSALLDLRDAGNRAVAERLLRPGGQTPASMRALAARMRSHGVVERDGYSVSERRRGFSVGARLGAALALDHQEVASERRLVDAVAWVRGGPPQRRFDCLGV